MDERIVQYFGGALTEEEERRLAEEINKNEALKDQYLSYLNLNGLLALQPQENDQQTGIRAYRLFKKKYAIKSKKRRWLVALLRTAALLILFLGTWFVSRYNTKVQLLGKASFNQISVPAGQRATAVLSDGSEVWLNAGSTLKYPPIFGDNNRWVELQGEGFFQIISDSKRPFYVKSPSFTIKVLGTSFNITDYEKDNYSEVALESGSIEVSVQEELHQLTPGEFLSLSDGKIAKGRFDENHFLWKTGLYYFESVPLSEIARKLEVYYEVTIDIQNPALKGKIYTGKFRQQDGVGEILRIIAKTCEFQIEREDFSTLYILK